MRIAIISDIHGNLVALETVLAALKGDNSDHIICLGDVAASGPRPRQCVELLRSLNMPIIMGNTDERLAAGQTFDGAHEDGQKIQDIDAWCLEQLTAADREFMASFYSTFRLEVGHNASLLCYHGSPRSNTDVIVATTPDEELEPMVAGQTATILAGGHTHAQMLRRYQEMMIINPGSVGLPFIETAAGTRNPPWTEYALVTYENETLSVDFRRAPLDVFAVLQQALDSTMPHAAWWMGDWTLE